MGVLQLDQIKDPITPTLIEHRVEAAKYPKTGEMAHYYNYIHYEFATPAGRVEALTYMEDTKRVIVTVPDGMGIDNTVGENILAYLQLRFERIEVRDESGNELLNWALCGETGPPVMKPNFHSNLDKEFAAVSGLWSPRVVAMMNGQHMKVVRAKGEFVWHVHADEEELFLVRKGRLAIRYRDRPDVILGEGDFHVVQRGVEHMTAADDECWVVLVEPAGTRHTGETESPLARTIEEQTSHLR